MGVGAVRRIRSAADLPSFRPGEVLVAAMTDPDWEPVLKGAAAVVTDQGGRTCHAAIVSREHGIPCVVGTGQRRRRRLRDGQIVTVSCAEGDVGRVYDGRIDFDREEVDPATLPMPRVPLMLNLASPETGVPAGATSTAGVGLLRIEFLISNWIGVHPMALLHPERVAGGRGAARDSAVAPARSPRCRSSSLTALRAGSRRSPQRSIRVTSSSASPTSRPTSTQACWAARRSSLRSQIR